MKPAINKLNKWHQTRLGLIVFALVELGLAYLFISLSVDKGNLWYYLLTLIFLVGFLQNLVKLIGTFFHGKRKAR